MLYFQLQSINQRPPHWLLRTSAFYYSCSFDKLFCILYFVAPCRTCLSTNQIAGDVNLFPVRAHSRAPLDRSNKFLADSDVNYVVSVTRNGGACASRYDVTKGLF